MQRSNQKPGMLGWFGNLIKSAVSAIGSAIGGPVGYVVGKVASYAVDRYVFGNHSAELKFFGIRVAGGGGLRGMLGDLILQTPQSQQIIANWMTKEFQPWLENEVKVLQGSDDANRLKSAEYRENVNRVLRALAYCEMYYKTNPNHLGLNAINVDDVEVDTTSRVTIIQSFKTAIREAYLEELEKLGVDVEIKKVSMRTGDYDGTTPEPFNWQKSAETTFEIFVEAGKLGGQKPIRAIVDQKGNDASITKKLLEATAKGETLKVSDKLDAEFINTVKTPQLAETETNEPKQPKSNPEKPKPQPEPVATEKPTYQPTTQQPTNQQPTNQQPEPAKTNEKKDNSWIWKGLAALGIGIAIFKK